MSRISRLVLVATLGGAGVILTPDTGVAQVQVFGGAGGAYLGPRGGLFGTPNVMYSNQLNVRVGSPLGPSLSYSQGYYGPAGWWLANSNTALAPRYPARVPYYAGYNSYMSGGFGNPVGAAAAQNLGRAQQQATMSSPYPGGVRNAITDQGGYEARAPGARPGPGVDLGANTPPELHEALAAADPSKLLSGEYLNRIADAIQAAEGRGLKGQSALFSPPLLADIRFGGSPAGTALNVIRRAGQLEFPAAFETVAGLRPLRPLIDQDLVAVASPLRLGKAADPAKVAALDADMNRAQGILTPAINTIPFEDATAARRFLNQLEATVKAVRDPKAGGLINPKWETEGSTAADLVKHMGRYKVRFGPAAPGHEDAYTALHQGLVGYLFTLLQNEPKPKGPTPNPSRP